MAPLKILISGGGVAGTALAFWLSKIGHAVTVVERFPSLRATGLQVDLRGHGIEVLQLMGLEKDFRIKSVKEEGMAIVDDSDRRWAFFRANRSGKGRRSFTTDFEIMRGDLCRLLHNATENVTYIFGTSITSYEEKNDLVEVLFADGRKDQFDLLVGADGQGSRTRKMMLGSETNDGFHALGGFHTGYFTARTPIQRGEEYIATSFTAPGSRSIMTRRHSPHSIQVYMGTRSERLESVRRGDVKEQKAAVTEIFQGAGWKSGQVLEWLAESDDFYLERMGVVKLDSWSTGRVGLVGDAAYCPSANTGMGTTSSIVGAYILAGKIARHCGNPSRGDMIKHTDGVTSALKAYEVKFRPFMDEVQKGLLEGSSWMKMIPTTGPGIMMMNMMLGAASSLRLDALASWVLREDIREWVFPKYEEMAQAPA